MEPGAGGLHRKERKNASLPPRPPVVDATNRDEHAGYHKRLETRDRPKLGGAKERGGLFATHPIPPGASGDHTASSAPYVERFKQLHTGSPYDSPSTSTTTSTSSAVPGVGISTATSCSRSPGHGGLLRRHPVGSNTSMSSSGDTAESNGEPSAATAARTRPSSSNGDVLRSRSDSMLDRFVPTLKFSSSHAGAYHENKLRRNSERIYVERIDYRVDSRIGFHLIDEEVPELTTFMEYCSDVLAPGEGDNGNPISNVDIDEESRKGRDRVYNLLTEVPLQLERLIDFGFCLLVDVFLSVLTMAPLRATRAVFTVLYAFASGRVRPGLSGEKLRQAGVTQEAVCDMCWVFMLGCGVWVLMMQNVSITYHSIRGQEFIKLYVLFNLLEICEKLCNSFGADTLDAIAFSAGQLLTAPASQHWHRKLAGDVLIGTAVVILHTLIILVQAITVNVAVNSKNNHLVGLLISNNFMELKTTVFKSNTTRAHFKLACDDIYERFHLTICLLFVSMEMFSKGGSTSWVPDFLTQVLTLFFFELVVDHVKHAFTCKLNNIAPNVFKDYLAELCRRATHFNVHRTHRVLVYEPIALACIAIKALLNFLRGINAGRWTGALAKDRMLRYGLLGGQMSVLFVFLLCCKLLIGWATQNLAVRYMNRHRANYPELYVVGRDGRYGSGGGASGVTPPRAASTADAGAAQSKSAPTSPDLDPPPSHMDRLSPQSNLRKSQ